MEALLKEHIQPSVNKESQLLPTTFDLNVCVVFANCGHFYKPRPLFAFGFIIDDDFKLDR